MAMAPAPQPLPTQPEINIKDYFDVIRRRKAIFIQVFVLVLTVGIVNTTLSKPVYSTYTKILVPAASSSVSLVDSNNPIATMLAAAQPDNVTTQLEILQSSPFLGEAMEKAGVKFREGVVPPAVSFAAVGGSNILQVTVEGGDPQEIKRLADKIVELHVKKTDLAQTTGLDDTLEFVSKEKLKTYADLEDAHNRLIAFQKDHRVAQLTAEQEANAKEYVALQTQLRETENNIASTRVQIADLKQRLNREPIDIVQESEKENSRRAKLEDRLDDMKVRRAELLQDFLPTSERIKDLDERIRDFTAQVEAEPATIPIRSHMPNPARAPMQAKIAELETDLRGTVTANNRARAAVAARKDMIQGMGAWEIEQARLIHERDALQSAYTTLSDRLRDLEIRKKARLTTARPIEPARVPGAPIRPKKATALVTAAVLALFLAAGMAFLQEYLDDRINSPVDVERLAALPTLGHVPLIGQNNQPLIASLPATSQVSEAYRALRSSVGFASIDAPLRRLLVTSASKGEGKTLTSVNLATAMAIDGKRVILVDADMRRPNVHRTLSVPSSPGLSEVLAGMRSIEEAIQDTSVPNLQVVCAGPIPPNPAELLGSRMFDTVLEQLEARADIVIVDSPPCMPVTDPLIVASRVDGVILVLHCGQTRKHAIRHAVEQLNRAHARIVGTVFNRVQANKSGSYYHYYYHYYQDGYYRDDNRNGRSGRQLQTQSGAKPLGPGGNGNKDEWS